MESRVEDAHLRDLVPEDLRDGVDALEVRRVVKGRQVGALLELLDHLVADEDRLRELLRSVDDPVSDGVDVVEAVDPLDLRPFGLHPFLDLQDRLAVVGYRLDALDRRLAHRFESEDGLLAAHLLDEALRDHVVGVGLEEVEVCVDDLELHGGAAAVKDEHVHF